MHLLRLHCEEIEPQIYETTLETHYFEKVLSTVYLYYLVTSVLVNACSMRVQYLDSCCHPVGHRHKCNRNIYPTYGLGHLQGILWAFSLT